MHHTELFTNEPESAGKTGNDTKIGSNTKDTTEQILMIPVIQCGKYNAKNRFHSNICYRFRETGRYRNTYTIKNNQLPELRLTTELN
jgi:hypothetical protein